jgi:L,D-peptidoglycan transpeptidase YkuD (ErfK/YbiS/YcfS/YnhG family)
VADTLRAMGFRVAAIVCGALWVSAGCGVNIARSDPPPMPVDSTPPTTSMGVDGPAVVDFASSGQSHSSPADRLDPYTVDSSCDLTTAAPIIARHGDGQYIIVRSDAWTSTIATVDVVVAGPHVPKGILCQRGGQAAQVGSAGMRPIVDRRSGDGTTPAGTFPLGVVTAWDGQTFSFFGNQNDPGVRGAFRRVRVGDCWGATPGEVTYNKLYQRTNCPGPDDEYLPSVRGAYDYAAVIGANLGTEISGDAPGEPAYAAAIFLHRFSYGGDGRPKPTRGCVSLALEDLIATIDLIDPARAPSFVIGTQSWLRSGQGG